MNLTGVNSTRHLATNKENIQPFANLKKQKKETQRLFGKDIQNLHKLPSVQDMMQIEEPITCLKPLSQINQPQNNPQHVPLFQNNILNYLKSKENIYLVDDDYMSKQKDINCRMRSILIDWLVDVNLKFKLLPQTLSLTVNVLDRYLSKHQMPRNILQLVGITSLMLVSKYEEIYPPSLKEYVGVCDNAYCREELLEMEAKILLDLEFDLTHTNSLAFLTHFQLKLNMEPKAFMFGRYILENALFDTSSLKYGNLVLAAGAVFLVNKIFKIENWKTKFEEVTLVSESTAKICAKDLYQIMQKVDCSNLTALKRKFSTPEYFEVSKYRIERVQNNPVNEFNKPIN